MAFSDSTHQLRGVPQGSELGPFSVFCLFVSLYTVQHGKIDDKYKVGRHVFTDGLWLYAGFQPNQAAGDLAVQNFEGCCKEWKAQMVASMLKLNDDKTEAVLCDPKTQQSRVSVNFNFNLWGESDVSLCNLVRNLGLLIDSSTTLHHNVSAVVWTCYFHLRTLGKLRPFLTKRASTSVAVSTLLSRLDYCDSCLWGLPGRKLCLL